MRFLRQYRYVLCVLAVVVFSLVMVLRQVMADQSAHVQRREDFLLLQERGDTGAERLYEQLIQELPDMNDRNLANDLQRTAMLIGSLSNRTESLVWKFHVSVGNELRKRADRRIARRATRSH